MKVCEGQLLFDIAIIGCGAAEAAFAFALLNDIPITDDLDVNQELVAPPVVNKDVATYYANNGINPATGITTIAMNIEEGIEYWAIEYDFIIN